MYYALGIAVLLSMLMVIFSDILFYDSGTYADDYYAIMSAFLVFCGKIFFICYFFTGGEHRWLFVVAAIISILVEMFWIGNYIRMASELPEYLTLYTIFIHKAVISISAYVLAATAACLDFEKKGIMLMSAILHNLLTLINLPTLVTLFSDMIASSSKYNISDFLLSFSTVIFYASMLTYAIFRIKYFKFS